MERTALICSWRSLSVAAIKLPPSALAKESVSSTAPEAHFDFEGTVHVPYRALSPSVCMVEQAKPTFIERRRHLNDADTMKGAPILRIQLCIETIHGKLFERVRSHAVKAKQQMFAAARL
jgi:hypothetical protein